MIENVTDKYTIKWDRKRFLIRYDCTTIHVLIWNRKKKKILDGYDKNTATVSCNVVGSYI